MRQVVLDTETTGLDFRLGDRVIAERTARLVSALEMRDFIDRRSEGFSQGQRTKTAIARALVHAPRNVLLDEPTNGLDVMTTRSLRNFLLEQRAAGRCVLLSSHIMQEVARLCDRIVVIAHGHVVADGTPDELRELSDEVAGLLHDLAAIGRAGIKMLIPIVLFILPPLFIVTLVPGLLSAFRDLRGGIGAR